MKHRKDIENSLKLSMASRLIREVFASHQASVRQMNQVLTPLREMRQDIKKRLSNE